MRAPLIRSLEALAARSSLCGALALALGCTSAPPPPQLGELPLRQPGECGVRQPVPPVSADIVLAIDGSRWTRSLSGLDVDRDGEVGRWSANALRFNPFSHSSDPADSLLVAQVAAARSLIHNLAGHDVRFSVVLFYGSEISLRDPVGRIVEPLTRHSGVLEIALQSVLGHVPSGLADLDPGLTAAVDAMAFGSEDASGGASRVVLLMASRDVSTSTTEREKLDEPAIEQARLHAMLDRRGPGLTQYRELAYGQSRLARRRIERQTKGRESLAEASARAASEGLRFDTFGLGPAAATREPLALGDVARATGGTYYPVAHLDSLYCRLLLAVLP